MSKSISIYVLVDPRDGDVRYVGWTSRSVRARLVSHMADRDVNYRTRWIKCLRSIGQQPIIRTVQVVSVEYASLAEQYWIRFFRVEGCRLVNGTDGGDGTVGRIVSDDAKARISAARIGKPLSAEHRAKLSAAHKGVPLSPSHRRNAADAHVGKKRSRESIEKMRLAKLGKRNSPEHVAKMVAARLGTKHSPETRAKMVQSAKAAWHARGAVSKETSRKISEGLKAAWARRRLASL